MLKEKKEKFVHIIIVSVIAVCCLLPILILGGAFSFLGISFKSNIDESKDQRVILYDLKLSLDTYCDEECLSDIKENLLEERGIYEVEADGNEIVVVYDFNVVNENSIKEIIDHQPIIISNEKVIMKCPERCSYCEPETGICKIFGVGE